MGSHIDCWDGAGVHAGVDEDIHESARIGEERQTDKMALVVEQLDV